MGATGNDPDSFTVRRGVQMNDLVRVTSWTTSANPHTVTVDDAAGFLVGGTVLMTDCVAAQVLTINAINANLISVNESLIGWTDASSFVTLVPLVDVAYNVDVATQQLMRNGNAIAGGVSNMKILYGVDTSLSPYNHEVTAYQANPANLADVVAMRIELFEIGDGLGGDRVQLNFPTTMTMRNRVADRP